MVRGNDSAKDHTNKYQSLDLNPGRLVFHCFAALWAEDEDRMFGEPVKNSTAGAWGLCV